MILCVLYVPSDPNPRVVRASTLAGAALHRMNKVFATRAERSGAQHQAISQPVSTSVWPCFRAWRESVTKPAGQRPSHAGGGHFRSDSRTASPLDMGTAGGPSPRLSPCSHGLAGCQRRCPAEEARISAAAAGAVGEPRANGHGPDQPALLRRCAVLLQMHHAGASGPLFLSRRRETGDRHGIVHCVLCKRTSMGPAGGRETWNLTLSILSPSRPWNEVLDNPTHAMAHGTH